MTLTIGDLGNYSHDQMGVFFEGVQSDTVTTAAGQILTKTYTVAVADGQLDPRLIDLAVSIPTP